MTTDIEEYYVDNSSEYMDIDEDEIDWNDRILEMEEDIPEESYNPDEDNGDETDDENGEFPESDSSSSDDEDDAPVTQAVDKKQFRTIKLTDKYISQQLTLKEFNRDRFRFRYKGEVMYGHILTISGSGKYIFDVVDIKTGQHSTKFLNGEFIDSY